MSKLAEPGENKIIGLRFKVLGFSWRALRNVTSTASFKFFAFCTLHFALLIALAISFLFSPIRTTSLVSELIAFRIDEYSCTLERPPAIKILFSPGNDRSAAAVGWGIV